MGLNCSKSGHAQEAPISALVQLAGQTSTGEG